MTWTLHSRTWIYKPTDPDYESFQKEMGKFWIDFYTNYYTAKTGYTCKVLDETGDGYSQLWFGLTRTCTDAQGYTVQQQHVTHLEISSIDVESFMWTDPSGAPNENLGTSTGNNTTSDLLSQNFVRGIEIWESDQDSEVYMLRAITPSGTGHVFHVEMPPGDTWMGDGTGDKQFHQPVCTDLNIGLSFYYPYGAISYGYVTGPRPAISAASTAQSLSNFFLLTTTASFTSNKSSFIGVFFKLWKDLLVRNCGSGSYGYAIGPDRAVQYQGDYYIECQYEQQAYPGLLFNTGAVSPVIPANPFE